MACLLVDVGERHAGGVLTAGLFCWIGASITSFPSVFSCTMVNPCRLTLGVLGEKGWRTRIYYTVTLEQCIGTLR